MEPRKIVEGYFPFNSKVVVLDEIILSYCTTQNLKSTLESIGEGEKIRTTFVKAVEKSYQYVEMPSYERADAIYNQLNLYSNRDDKEVNASLEKKIQDAVINLVTFHTGYASSLLLNTFEKNTRNALRLENYLLDAGADCASCHLTGDIIHELSVDRLSRLLTTKVKYKVTDKHGGYLAESHMGCCCPCCPRVYAWSPMLVAGLEPDIQKVKLMVDQYPQYVQSTAIAIDLFYDRVQMDSSHWRSCIVATLTCGLYYPAGCCADQVAYNPLTHRPYTLVDFATAKYNLMSAATSWVYDSRDKEQIRLYFKTTIESADSIQRCFGLYEQFLESKVYRDVESSNQLVIRSFFARERYLPLKIEVIESLQERVLDLLHEQKASMEPIPYLRQLQAVLGHDLFSENHLARGVSGRVRARLSRHIDDLQPVEVSIRTPLIASHL